jgi:hypothetical protein
VFPPTQVKIAKSGPKFLKVVRISIKNCIGRGGDSFARQKMSLLGLLWQLRIGLHWLRVLLAHRATTGAYALDIEPYPAPVLKTAKIFARSVGPL